jgi:hypothetical protein
MEDFNINSNELLRELKRLRDLDPEGFCNLIMKSLSFNPDAAVDDPAPKEIKINSLNRLKEYFESIEDYENCALLKNLIDRINGSE